MLGDINPSQVRVTPGQPTIYRGRDNPAIVRFSTFAPSTRYDIPLDFSAVTRVILTLSTGDTSTVDPDQQIVFDSAIVPDSLDWTAQGLKPGEMKFNLAYYDIPIPVSSPSDHEGGYEASIIVYDAAHPEGQVITGEGPARLSFDFVGSYTSGTTPAPLPTGGPTVLRTAGTVLSALRVVTERDGSVYLADPLVQADTDFIVGITVTTAQQGAQVVVQRAGTLDDAGWTWIKDLVYLGANGMLTQTAPVTGAYVVIGSAPSPTRINVDIRQPIYLEI